MGSCRSEPQLSAGSHESASFTAALQASSYESVSFTAALVAGSHESVSFTAALAAASHEAVSTIARLVAKDKPGPKHPAPKKNKNSGPKWLSRMIPA